MKSYMVSEAP